MSVSTAVRNPRTFVGNKWRRFKTLLVDPEAFYERNPDSDRLWNEILVVFLIGITGTVGMYYVSDAIMTAFAESPLDTPSDVGLQVQMYALRPLIEAFVVWFGFSIAFYAISWLYSGRGSLFGMTKKTAWSLVPLFFANLLYSAGLLAAGWNVDIEVTRSMLTQTNAEVRAELFEQVTAEPAAIAGLAVGVVFIVWSAYIAAYAVADVREIPIVDAYKVAAVPPLLYLLYRLNLALSLAGVL